MKTAFLLTVLLVCVCSSFGKTSADAKQIQSDTCMAPSPPPGACIMLVTFKDVSEDDWNKFVKGASRDSFNLLVVDNPDTPNIIFRDITADYVANLAQVGSPFST